MKISRLRSVLCVGAIAFVSVIIFSRAASPQAEGPFVIGGFVRFENGKPADQVEVWLKSTSGAVSTRTTATKPDGSFQFELPPPIATKFKLLVYPYGFEYPNLAPEKQQISVVIPGTERMSFANYTEKLPERSRLLVYLKYEDFFRGVKAEDEPSRLVLDRLEKDVFPAISARSASYDLQFQPAKTLTGPWYQLQRKQ